MFDDVMGEWLLLAGFIRMLLTFLKYFYESTIYDFSVFGIV